MAVERARLRHIIRIGLPASLYFAFNAFEMWRADALWEAAALLVMALLVAATAVLAPIGSVQGWQAVVYYLGVFVGLFAWIVSVDPIVNSVGFVAVVVTHVGALVLARKGLLNLRPPEPDSV